MSKKIALVLMALSLVQLRAYAQDEHIFLVKAFDCASKPSQRSQTGFRAQGIRGIITALHGVADCQRIVVKGDKALILFEHLIISTIDIERDMALLSSTELDSKDQGGLEVAKNTTWSSLEKLRVYGHPYGIARLDTSLDIRKPAVRPLKDLIPPGALPDLRSRNSPNPLINVLSLQGNILPGHSGAPIVDSQGRVIAVANGGLQKGQAGICWAIPFEDVEWEPASSNRAFISLRHLQVESLFVFDNSLPDLSNTVSDTLEEFCISLNKLVESSRVGFISIVKPGMFDWNFQSRIDLPGSSYSDVMPRTKVAYVMSRSNKKNIVESEYYNLIYKLTICLPKWSHEEFVRKKEVLQHPGRSFKLREGAAGTMVEVHYDFEPFLDDFWLWLYVYAPGAK